MGTENERLKVKKRNNRIPPIEYLSLIKVFRHLGFNMIRNHGSHRIFGDNFGTRVCIVSKKMVGSPAILDYIRQSKITKSDFLNVYHNIIMN